jgi:glycosyltransferase involved in cell wall biosynthesis
MQGGGMERQIVELLKGLRQRGSVRVVLGVLDRGGPFEADAAALVDAFLPLSRRWRFDVTPALAVARYARRHAVGLIDTFGWMSSYMGLVTARLLGVSLINESIQNAFVPLPIRDRLSRWCLVQSDVVVANSYSGLRAFGFAPSIRVRVIRNGIDMQRFEGVKPVTGRRPALCMVANFNQYKDHATVVRALPSVLEAFPDTVLRLVGREAGTLATIRRLVSELGLAGAVTFVENTKYPEPYIAGSDIGLLASSQGEGISNALLEYMALGKPVVATDWPGNAEVVLEGQTGQLVPPNSSSAFAEIIKGLLYAPDRARSLGEAGRQRVIRDFPLEHLVAEHEALYDSYYRTRRA